jgi:HK97 family phage prohead protease
MKDKEIRSTFSGELRVVDGPAEGPPLIVGYAAMFGKLSKLIRTENRSNGWRERVAPGAFSRTLASGEDIFAFVEHSPNHKLGRRSTGTLKLTQDERGLYVEITPPDTTVGMDAIKEIRRGDLSGWSFGFRAKPSDQTWIRTENDELLRELHSLDLFEVTLTGAPAYPDSTELALRSVLEPALTSLEAWEQQQQRESQAALEAEQRLRENRLRLLRG